LLVIKGFHCLLPLFLAADDVVCTLGNGGGMENPLGNGGGMENPFSFFPLLLVFVGVFDVFVCPLLKELLLIDKIRGSRTLIFAMFVLAVLLEPT
jgi:hypothetical protein